MSNSKAVTDMKIYKDRLDDLQERLLKTHDIKPGEVQPMRPLKSKKKHADDCGDWNPSCGIYHA